QRRPELGLDDAVVRGHDEPDAAAAAVDRGHAAIFSTAAASTRHPSTMSRSSVSSAMSWLRPPIEGMKSIALGSAWLMIIASCPAPLGSDKGASPSARL